MEPVLFKEREDGHGVRGAGLRGVLSGAPSSSTIVLILKTERASQPRKAAESPAPSKASGEGWDVLGRELHQRKKTFHVSPERNQLHLVLMDIRNDKAARGWTSGTLVMTATAGGTFPQYHSLLVKEENQCCGGLGGSGY